MPLNVSVLSGAGEEDLSEQASLRRRGIGDTLEQAVEAGRVGHSMEVTTEITMPRSTASRRRFSRQLPQRLPYASFADRHVQLSH